MKVPLPIARLGAQSLTLLDAEVAHHKTIALLKSGFIPNIPPLTAPCLQTHLAGLAFPSPLGLAAGFDKNAEVIDASLALGFGFTEAGAVTPRAQAGNERPRVFRLRADRAIINRYGFNNQGLDKIASRLAQQRQRPGIVGINLGANKDTEDKAEDYITCLTRLEPLVDFCTINISSPNTPGLRHLQSRTALQDLLQRIFAARQTDTPIFLKIAPDLSDEDRADICALCLRMGIDGLVISNTTLSRPSSLRSPLKHEAGGLSGAPLYKLSLDVLKDFAKEIDGRIPLIGVGGIANTDQAYEKILNGASLVQLYSALIFEGPDLPSKILRGLTQRLKSDGYASIKQAVGAAL
ncbi:MAG: quinone-dependent dihydroorotate dehydrogenase [bacterium]